MKKSERRGQLLDCAQNLFFTKGMAETTMVDILTATGVSKGAFYHHFKSKDELLFGVLDRMAASIFARLRESIRDETTPAMELLTRYLHQRSAYLREQDFPGQIALFRMMHEDKNIVLLELFKRRVRETGIPIFQRIVERGVREGVFKVADPETTSEMILHVVTFLDFALLRAIDARGTEFADLAARKLQHAIDLQFLTIDRVLGLPDGTTDFGWPEAVEATMAVPVTHT